MKNDEHSSRRDTVEEIVDDCQVYWVLSGLPRRRLNEIKLELEQHLRDALADGKTVEDVVGADVNTFAAAWVKEVRTSKTLGQHVLDWSFLLLLAATVVLPWQHLEFRATAFPVYWDSLAAVGFVILGTKVFLWPGLLTGALFRRPRQWRGTLVISIVISRSRHHPVPVSFRSAAGPFLLALAGDGGAGAAGRRCRLDRSTARPNAPTVV